VADFVVAVDGPAGSGKSSVCREAASRLGFGYLDTGAGYRAFTLHASRQSDLESAVASFDYKIGLNPKSAQVFLDGIDVTGAIRTEEVANQVSKYAKQESVRKLQREDARARIIQCTQPGIIVEGRDITTVVSPDADLRILLTASTEARLARRAKDSTESAANQLARDASDSSVAEFLEPADGVLLLDTTNLDFEESVRALINEIEKVRR
jgi:cytidylate kinase